MLFAGCTFSTDALRGLRRPSHKTQYDSETVTLSKFLRYQEIFFFLILIDVLDVSVCTMYFYMFSSVFNVTHTTPTPEWVWQKLWCNAMFSTVFCCVSLLYSAAFPAKYSVHDTVSFSAKYIIVYYGVKRRGAACTKETICLDALPCRTTKVFLCSDDIMTTMLITYYDGLN